VGGACGGQQGTGEDCVLPCLIHTEFRLTLFKYNFEIHSPGAGHQLFADFKKFND
jgi:hypothetical protein